MHPQAGLPLLPPLTIAYWNQRPNVTWDKAALFLHTSMFGASASLTSLVKLGY